MKHLELIDLHAHSYIVHDANDGELSTFEGRIYPATEPKPAEPQSNPQSAPGPVASPTPTPGPLQWPKIKAGGGLGPRFRAPQPIEKEFHAWDELSRHAESLEAPYHATLRLHDGLPTQAEQHKLVHSLRRGVAVTVVT